MALKRKDARPGGPPSRPQAVDQPSAGGVLDGILRDHNISAVTDQAGHALLLRPNSVVVDAPKGDTRNRLSATLPKLVPGARAEFADDDLAIVTLPVVRRKRRSVTGTDDGAGDDSGGEVRDATDLLGLLRKAKFDAEYNHVVIGSQSVSGSPLGVTASWAGDMAFVGTITDQTIDGKPVILSTAQPSAPPPGALRLPLAIPGRVPPRVLVLDTGLRTELLPGATKRAKPIRRPEHHALHDCRTRPGGEWLTSDEPGVVDDEDEPNDDKGRPILDFEAGHGTFIAGIVRQICPDAVVHSAGVLSSFGDGDVYGVIRALDRVLAEIGEVDIVVMSFGTNLVGDKPGLFGSELNRVLGSALGVAAAGNQNTCRPYFPAALPDVIGVGGLAADGKAWFTNFGGWVDACAPAVDVVSTFFNRFDETLHIADSSGTVTPTVARRYRGWARWSGTSFAAPKVAALIAQEMYLNGRPGQTARDAWDRLTSYRHYRYPDLGIVFNV